LDRSNLQDWTGLLNKKIAMMNHTHLIVFTTRHPWIVEVVNEVKPEEFEVAFLDMSDEAQAQDLLPKADFLVCIKLSRAHAKLLTRCKLVMHNGVGYDAIDQQAMAEMGIPLAVTPAMTPEGVSEHALMMMLSLYKQAPAVRRSMLSGEWDMFGWRQNSHNLSYKTVGIVGLGRIGKRLARLLHAFDCTLLYNDIVEMPAELEACYQLRRVEFETLLAESDIVTLHVPLTELTGGMMGAKEFGMMKEGAVFINTCRGETYEMDALYEALTSGHLYGAGLDVFDPEPAKLEHPLFQMPNVVFSPHIASGTVERQYGINRAQFANAQRVLDGLEPNDLVS
ncbi:MAG: 2-hydroxyacid dehydrogenase, partial [Chloroflexota bacterium]